MPQDTALLLLPLLLPLPLPLLSEVETFNIFQGDSDEACLNGS